MIPKTPSRLILMRIRIVMEMELVTMAMLSLLMPLRQAIRIPMVLETMQMNSQTIRMRPKIAMETALETKATPSRMMLLRPAIRIPMV